MEIEQYFTSSVISEWSAFSDDNLARQLKKLNFELSARFSFEFIQANLLKDLAEFITERLETAAPNAALEILQMLRFLCRDKACCQTLLNKKLTSHLITFSGLSDSPATSAESKFYNKIKQFTTALLEAERCLCNGIYTSQVSRDIFTKLACENLITRWLTFQNGVDELSVNGVEKPLNPTETLYLWYYDLRLLFLLTAFQLDVQARMRTDHVIIETLLKSVDEFFDDVNSKAIPAVPHELRKLSRGSEALKILYNILCRAERELSSILQAAEISRIIHVSCRFVALEDEALAKEFAQGGVNLLTVMPISTADVESHICPLSDDASSTFHGRDMLVLDKLLDFVKPAVEKQKTHGESALVSTYFVVLLKIVSESAVARRYCRLKVFPPLRAADVEHLPDAGDDLRSVVIKAMTALDSNAVAAEFAFVLCKRSVDRLLKYTGFGHAAGFLTNTGLLGKLSSGPKEDDSEDSETEDYARVRHQVNPVTGHIAPEKDATPFAGMTEEQAMHEASKLMSTIDKLMSTGVVKPATVGPDGKLREVEHVLELVKDHGKHFKDDSDSD